MKTKRFMALTKVSRQQCALCGTGME